MRFCGKNGVFVVFFAEKTCIIQKKAVILRAN